MTEPTAEAAWEALTDEERNRFRDLMVGSRFVGTARDGVIDFADQHDWSDRLLAGVQNLVNAHGSPDRS